jgi:hypothetical protein
MRNIAWHAGSAKRFDAGHGIFQFGFVQFRLVALDFRKQSGEFCNARCLAYRSALPAYGQWE